MRVLIVLMIVALPLTATADELILKNGQRIEFRVLKDGVDVVHIQTPDNRTLEVPKNAVREVRFVTPKAPLTGATFTDDDTVAASKPVNLLRLIRPKQHGVLGEWRFTGGTLHGKDGLLETPFIPPGSSYDVEIVVERRSGNGTVSIGLAAEGRSFAFVLDGDGSISGISVIGGRHVSKNKTRINGRQLLPGKPRHVVCAVRTGRIVVLLDRKQVVSWKGDLKTLSHWNRPKHNANLWIAMQGAIAVKRYIVTVRRLEGDP